MSVFKIESSMIKYKIKSMMPQISQTSVDNIKYFYCFSDIVTSDITIVSTQQPFIIVTSARKYFCIKIFSFILFVRQYMLIN